MPPTKQPCQLERPTRLQRAKDLVARRTETLSYQISLNCPISADVRQLYSTPLKTCILSPQPERTFATFHDLFFSFASVLDLDCPDPFDGAARLVHCGSIAKPRHQLSVTVYDEVGAVACEHDLAEAFRVPELINDLKHERTAKSSSG